MSITFMTRMLYFSQSYIGDDMPNIRNDSKAVEEAWRQADIIAKAVRSSADRTSLDETVANALLDIWQKDQPDFILRVTA